MMFSLPPHRMVLLAFSALWFSGSLHAAPKAALVIGNSAYTVGDRLKNPINDAADIAAKLTKLGFVTILRKDANYDDMLEGLRKLKENMEPGGVAVFYYAGHGMQVDGQNYLIPVDARMDDRDRVDRDGFKISTISRSLLESGTKENLMIIDACRNDPFPKKYRSGDRGLARVDSSLRSTAGGSDLMMLFAASPGTVAMDGNGRNGLFTGEMLKHMDSPNQSMSQLFQQIKKGVLQASSGKQLIYMEGDPLADFYFKLGKPQENTTSTPMEAEVSFWNSIQSSTDASDFEEYLKQYPNGRYAGLAKNRKQKYGTQTAGTAAAAGSNTALGGGSTKVDEIKPVAAKKPEEKPSVKPSTHSTLSGMDAVSYSLGYTSGKNDIAAFKNLNIDHFELSYRDGYAGRDGQFSEDEMKTVLTDYKAYRLQEKKDVPPPNSAKLAYSLGYLFGKKNAAAIVNLDTDRFMAALRDGYFGLPSLLSENEIKKVLTDYKNEREEQAKAELEQQGIDNKRKGNAYLAENARKAGVQTTTSGLQYEVINNGSGARPKASDTVEVHYESKFIDGTVLDSSIARGQTSSFRLDQVIPGWTEGVQLMREGAKYRLTLPANLAYGALGADSVPPNAVLVFEVQLIKVSKSK